MLQPAIMEVTAANMEMPDLQPMLTGSNVIVRPVCKADWPGMFAAAADPAIWAGHPARDRYTEPVFRTFFEGAIASEAAFAIVDRRDGKIIGSSRYHGFDETAREIEIGWTFLARDYWGGSINHEVKHLMLEHAFSFADRVVFWIGKDNLRSQRATAKIGGVKREGILRRLPRDNTTTYVVFDITKSEYCKSR